MTLAIGQPPSRPRRSCAFTLIELVLVLALLVVAVSMVAPRMSGFIRGRAMDSEARRLMAVLHAGQARAVSEGMSIVLWIDQKQNEYGLEEETPGKDGDRKAESFMADDNVRVSAVNLGVSAPVTFNNLPAVRFLPDGTVDEGSPKMLQLQDSSGNSLWLVETSDRKGYEIRTSDK
jgi:type II secretion system protein H